MLGPSQDATEESHEEDKHSRQDTDSLSGACDTAGRTNKENGEEEPNPQATKKERDGKGGGESNKNKDREKEIETQAEKKENDETGKGINTNETENEEEIRENNENIAEQVEGSSDAEIKPDEKCVKEEKKNKNAKIVDSKDLAPKTTETELKAKDEAKVEVKKASSRNNQEKTKGKSGVASSSSGLRPSMQMSSRQRSAKPSARRDAMAKFQQDS